VLRALLDERSVSRAAHQLRLSQSATSHALGRLRAVLGDPLFVRTRAGLVPTARAQAMAATVRSSLDGLETAFFSPLGFDPRKVNRTFCVRPSDYVECLLIPRLIERLAEVAPGVDLFSRATATEPALALERGELDLLIQPTHPGEPTDGLRHQELWADEFVGVARRGHPLTRGRLSLARFAAARHVVVAPRGLPGGGRIDEVLRQHGLERRIAFSTPSFLAAQQVVATTDLVLVTPARIAAAVAGPLGLVTFEPPVEISGFQIAMFWHDRHDADPSHEFLRKQIAIVARESDSRNRAALRRSRPRAHHSVGKS
jgi:DNA-binding transcriptional LysR family regulator